MAHKEQVECPKSQLPRGMKTLSRAFSHHLMLFGLDTQFLDPFSLVILGMTTVSLLAGVGHSELCPTRAFLLEEP